MADKVLKRNIIIVGKTGCGKSTLGNQIIDTEGFEVKDTLNSVQADVNSKHNVVTIGEAKYEITVTDTIGFFDTKEREQRFNDTIMARIITEIKEIAPDGLNLIIFAFKAGRFTQEEKECFDLISKNFRLFEKASLLVITNCGGKNESSRKLMVEDFQSNDITKPYAEFMQQGIITVDFPDVRLFDDDLKQVYKPKMKKDQAILHKIIAKADKTYLADEIQSPTFWEKVVTLACPLLSWFYIRKFLPF